jgi:hypothetical protein
MLTSKGANHTVLLPTQGFKRRPFPFFCLKGKKSFLVCLVVIAKSYYFVFLLKKEERVGRAQTAPAPHLKTLFEKQLENR